MEKDMKDRTTLKELVAKLEAVSGPLSEGLRNEVAAYFKESAEKVIPVLLERAKSDEEDEAQILIGLVEEVGELIEEFEKDVKGWGKDEE
jgi:hypothetical protein